MKQSAFPTLLPVRVKASIIGARSNGRQSGESALLSTATLRNLIGQNCINRLWKNVSLRRMGLFESFILLSRGTPGSEKKVTPNFRVRINFPAYSFKYGNNNNKNGVQWKWEYKYAEFYLHQVQLFWD